VAVVAALAACSGAPTPAVKPAAVAAPAAALAPASSTAPAAPVAAASPGAPGAPIHPLRAAVAAFGGTLDVEIRDLPRAAAEGAVQAAVAEAAGQPRHRFINQRTGQPAEEGIFALLAVTELATDAQALNRHRGAPPGRIPLDRGA
jgi:hypothetical protein